MTKRRRSRGEQTEEKRRQEREASARHVNALLAASETVRSDHVARNARVLNVAQEYGIPTNVLSSASVLSANWKRTELGDWLQYATGIYLAFIALRDGSLLWGLVGLFGVTWVIGHLREENLRSTVDDWAKRQGTTGDKLRSAMKRLDQLESHASELAFAQQRQKERDDLLNTTGRVPDLYPSAAAPGFVYIVSNPSIPGFVKVGMTTRPMHERLGELYSTSVPTPFELDAAWPVRLPRDAEAKAHRILEKHRRVDSREFFAIDSRTAVLALSGLLGRPVLGKLRDNS